MGGGEAGYGESSFRVWYIPNANHNEDAGYVERRLAGDLPPALHHVKRAVAASFGPSDGKVKHNHAHEGHDEAKDALPGNDFDGRNRRPFKEVLLKHKLRGGEDLGTRDEENTDGGQKGVGSDIVGVFRHTHNLLLVRPDDAGQADKTNTDNDTDEGEPLESEKPPLEEEDAEQADKEYEGAARHLVDGSGDHEQTNVHERRATHIADSREREEKYADALELAIGLGGCAVDINLVRIGLVPLVGVKGFVAGGRLGDVAAVDGCDTHDDPASHLANKHLQGLENRLVEVLAFREIGIVTVASALVVLLIAMPLLVCIFRRDKTLGNEIKYLVFCEQRVADACQQHHAHQEREHSPRRHGYDGGAAALPDVSDTGRATEKWRSA